MSIVELSIYCEHRIRNVFTTLAENRYAEKRMLNFGGIISADSIRNKGGLYIALVSTLARYYNEIEEIEKIDNFIDKSLDIQYKELKEIPEEYVKEMLSDFKEIAKDTKVK